jgi:RNA recognition motif-containing protein
MTEGATGGLCPLYQTYTRQKCFIAYSEQAPWSVDLLSACKEVLNQPEYNLEVDYARKHFAADMPLRQKALELIANARYGIYDLSYWRQDERSSWQMPRNVMIELGIAIAWNRPIFLLRHASNRELPLPEVLQGLSEQILEFSGSTTLKEKLIDHLPRWIHATPETAWWNRYCTFGGRVCDHREAHPQTKQLGKKELTCVIADGKDPCRPDFRSVIEDVLNRFSDISYTYLDSLSLREGYSFFLCGHCQTARFSPFAIYRITSCTPVEAFVTIGMSLVLEAQFNYECPIPRVLITENVQNIPSLLTGYEVCIARNDKELKSYLKEFVPEVLIKVRQTSWKTRPLPFIEILANPLEEIELHNASELQEDNPNTLRGIHISNLSPQVTSGDLITVFERYGGTVERGKLSAIDPQTGALVKMKTAKQAQEAVEKMNGIEWMGYTLEAKTVNFEKLANFFTEEFEVIRPSRKQQILSVRRQPHQTDSLTDKKSTETANSKTDITKDSSLTKAFEKASNRSANVGSQQNKSIYVGNLSYQVTSEDLRTVFSEYGKVIRVKLPTDRITGRPRGFAFVEMATEVDANVAIQTLNGAEWMGRLMRVSKARLRINSNAVESESWPPPDAPT